MPVSVFFSYAGILIFDTFPVSAGEIQGIIIINFTADTANDYPKSFKVSAILNTPQVNLKL